MVSPDVSTGFKPKPRGRPPGKAKNSKVTPDSVLDASGREKSDGTENIGHVIPAPIGEVKNGEILNPQQFTAPDFGTLCDSIKISDGKNEVAIVLYKKVNNTFGLRIMLNNQTEIRPVTYNGYSPAMTLWNLLKRSLN